MVSTNSGTIAANAPENASSVFSDSFLSSTCTIGSSTLGRGTGTFDSCSTIGKGAISAGLVSITTLSVDSYVISISSKPTVGSDLASIGSCATSGVEYDASTSAADALLLARLEIGVTCPATSNAALNSEARDTKPSLFAAGLAIRDSTPLR